MHRCLVLITLAFLLALPALAVETAMVAMTDGKHLATDYYLPETGGPALPVILVRTTYGRERHAGEAKSWNARGVALVAQDTRGRGGSEDIDRAFGDDGWGERHDGADTVAWIKAQPWCNGKIGTMGGSALGITQALLAGATQDITCQSMVVAASNFYDQIAYQGGVFHKVLAEGWLEAQKSEHVLDIWKAHPAYDEFWQRHNVAARAPEITAPALHVGGWFDIFGKGTIENFTSREQHGGEGARGNQYLVMGPWIHGVMQKIGDLTFPDNFNFDFGKLHDRFMEHWLLGKDTGLATEPRVHYYTMGDCVNADAPGNEWRTASAWPPFPITPTPYYLASDLMLSTTPSTADEFAYVYDPANPCPSRGGANLFPPAGPFDQRAIGERADVLKFVTAPLEAPIECTGPISVRLFVSTDAADTDFTAKLIDIYPDGKEILIHDGIHRLKFREDFTEPKPAKPGEVVEVNIDLWQTSIIFDKGHRISVHISSSNYPRFEKNPNTGEDFPNEENLRKANNTIHVGPDHPSALILSVPSAIDS